MEPWEQRTQPQSNAQSPGGAGTCRQLHLAESLPGPNAKLGQAVGSETAVLSWGCTAAALRGAGAPPPSPRSSALLQGPWPGPAPSPG